MKKTKEKKKEKKKNSNTWRVDNVKYAKVVRNRSFPRWDRMKFSRGITMARQQGHRLKIEDTHDKIKIHAVDPSRRPSTNQYKTKEKLQ